jgi:hypothetical protein
MISLLLSLGGLQQAVHSSSKGAKRRKHCNAIYRVSNLHLVATMNTSASNAGILFSLPSV